MASLNTAQTAVFQLKPIWRKYLKSLENHNNSAFLQVIEKVSLASFQSGTLKLQCQSSTIATQVKHQVPTIIDFLNQNLSAEGNKNVCVERVEIQVKPYQTKTLNSAQELSQKCHRTVDPNAPLLIDQLSSNINSEELATSLKKLADTLKNS